MSTTWRFLVPGPLPVMRRPRSGKNTSVHHTHPRTRADQERVRDAFFKLYGSPRTPKNVGLTVLASPSDRRYPDLVNVIACVQDALNQVCWEDDRQVKKLSGEMTEYDPSHIDGVIVTVREL